MNLDENASFGLLEAGVFWVENAKGVNLSPIKIRFWALFFTVNVVFSYLKGIFCLKILS